MTAPPYEESCSQRGTMHGHYRRIADDDWEIRIIGSDGQRLLTGHTETEELASSEIDRAVTGIQAIIRDAT